jgi:hypothetical protein
VQLDTKFHLIDLLIQDLVHLKQAVSQDVDSGLMNEDILLRHGVLVFLLSESSLKLNRAQLLSIWQLCVVKYCFIEKTFVFLSSIECNDFIFAGLTLLSKMRLAYSGCMQVAVEACS